MKRREFFKTAAIQPFLVTGAAALTAKTAKAQGDGGKVADLVPLFKAELELCKVQEGETVLFYSSGQFARPEYISATIAAARSLGASAYALQAPSDLYTQRSGGYGEAEGNMLLEAFKAADIVLGAIPLYTDAHNAALAAGTRTIMVQQEQSTLRRMFPDEAVINRTYAGARAMRDADEIRVTCEGGSDFTMRKDGRKGHAQVGISDKPGRWDHWPSGLVACAPLETKTEGVYVVNPGDVILGLGRYCETPVKIHFSEGRITDIEGDYDAAMIRDRLKRFEGATTPGQLSDPYRIAHAGWGTEHRAQWHTVGMDSESLYGTVMVSIGRNMFDSKDEFAGLGGKNYTPVHIDICCRNKQLYLDGELVVDSDETFAKSELG